MYKILYLNFLLIAFDGIKQGYSIVTRHNYWDEQSGSFHNFIAYGLYLFSLLSFVDIPYYYADHQ